jgi:hypothetical protein
MKFNELPEFEKEFKKLRKKYKSLPNDLKIFKEVLTKIPLGNSKHFNILHNTEELCIVKARFFCKYLKGNSLRIVYGYLKKEKKVEFIEIYSKSKKKREDKEKIKKYLSGLK